MERLPRRVRLPLTAAVSLHAVLAAMLGLASLTCSGWAIGTNNKALLGFRLGAYLVASGLAIPAVARNRSLEASSLLVCAGLCYVWLETGWLFRQPAFGPPSSFALLPFVIALIVLLAPHSPTLRAQAEGASA